MLKNNKEEFYYGFTVDIYDKVCSEKVYEQRAAKVMRFIKLYNPKAKKLLELACGTGNFTKQLAKKGFIIKATDISKDQIKKAKSKGINASFSVANMSDLHDLKKYDIVCCFWQSFCYLPSYKVCENTLKRIHDSLENKGLFFVDFSNFPPHHKPFKNLISVVDLKNGLRVMKQTSFLTKGNFDTRWDNMRYELNGKDITGQKFKWNGKYVLLKPKLSRSPLLRISRKKMEQMLKKSGFKVLNVDYGFAGFKESMLFVAQKI